MVTDLWGSNNGQVLDPREPNDRVGRIALHNDGMEATRRIVIFRMGLKLGHRRYAKNIGYVRFSDINLYTKLCFSS